MQYRTLGNSGIEVSALSLGSWMTYEFMAEDDALAVIRAAIEGGVNFLDDARYNDRTGQAPISTGYSEILFGRLLKQGGWERGDLIIANKLWYEFYPEQTPEQELDASLERLQLDYLDLAYCAAPPSSVNVEKTVQEIGALIKTGKLRQWGILNWSAEQIATAHQLALTEGVPPPCAAQLSYSILSHSHIENPQARASFAAAGIGIVASYSLQGGVLSGKYNFEAAPSIRFKDDDLEKMKREGLTDKVARLIKIADELHATPAQVALAYCLKNDQVSSVLFGATRVSQVKENLRALELVGRLDAATLGRLRALE